MNPLDKYTKSYTTGKKITNRQWDKKMAKERMKKARKAFRDSINHSNQALGFKGL